MARTIDRDTELIAGNRETECAAVRMLLTAPADAQPLIAELCDRDFCWSDTGFAFCELQRMAQARVRIDDPADIQQWLKRKESRRRMTEAGCDAAQDPVAMLVGIADAGGSHNLSCDEIIQDLRRWRKTRALRLLGYGLIKMIDQQPSEPNLVMTWVDDQLDRISEMKMTLEAAQ
jgi:hypothetical protein